MFSKRQKFRRKPKTIAATLVLTSLVDAFSIMVIFLIVVATGSSDFQSTPDLVLPNVATAAMLNQGPRLVVNEKGYRFQERNWNLDGLAKVLQKEKLAFANKRAVIEADKGITYEKLEPLMRLLSELEIENIQLAVQAEATP